MAPFRQSVALEDDKVWVKRGLLTWLHSGKAWLLKMTRVGWSGAFKHGPIQAKLGF